MLEELTKYRLCPHHAAMIAFEVSHNGNPVCVAGIGDQGVVSCGVDWVRRDRHPNDDLENDDGTGLVTELNLHVGGLHTPADEHRTWAVPEMKVGDEVTVKVIETAEVTPHAEARSRKHDPERKRDYVRQTARELGWTIIEGPAA